MRVNLEPEKVLSLYEKVSEGEQHFNNLQLVPIQLLSANNSLSSYLSYLN